MPGPAGAPHRQKLIQSIASACFQHRYCRQYIALYKLEERATTCGNVRYLIRYAEFIDRGNGLAAAGNGKAGVISNRFGHRPGAIGKRVKLEYAQGAIPDNGFHARDNVGEHGSGFRPYIQNHLIVGNITDILGDSLCIRRKLLGNHHINRQRDIGFFHQLARRVDQVSFHPAYHQLMAKAMEEGLHSSPWTHPGKGAHVARAAKYYMHSQVEAAHCCPITMTFAAIPSIRKQPELAAVWEQKILANQYDPANCPDADKQSVTIGMAMTEKQGGSDVRANTTRASPVGTGGPGEAYELVGHKWFVSAPMCDAFLVLAQTDAGLSCFLMPRWRPDGSKNPWQIQQLKNKMGNVANASSEVELRGALAWMVGEEGRGVRTIIEMVAMTRFDCMIGSSAGMRQAFAQASHHCHQRSAFGAKLSDQPLMQNVLADLAIESEAAMAYTLRVARALDNQDNEHEKLLARLATPVGKYWICKRTANHAY